MRAGLIYSLLLIFALAGAGPAWADEKSPQPGVQSAPAAQAAPGVAPGTADLRRDQELLKRDFKHLEKINQERIQFLEKQMESQNERFADYSSHSERNANIITLLGIFIALAGIVAGYSAIISARKQGREVVRKWIDEHEDEIHEYLKKDMEGKIDDRVSEAEIKILKKIKMEELMERVAQKIAAREIDKVSRNDKEKLEQAAFEAGAKVESERTYNDWESQAVSALLSEKYESAETSFDHAAKLDGIFPFQRAKALSGKASALASMEKWDESLSVYDDVIPLMENSEDSENIHWYSVALTDRAFSKLGKAKFLLQSIEINNEVIELLTQSVSDSKSSLKLLPDVPIVLGNLGYALFLLGNETEAESELRKALELGGEKIRDAELKDADIHPLPQDEAFKELINRLWEEVSTEKGEDGDGEKGGG